MDAPAHAPIAARTVSGASTAARAVAWKHCSRLTAGRASRSRGAAARGRGSGGTGGCAPRRPWPARAPRGSGPKRVACGQPRDATCHAHWLWLQRGAGTASAFERSCRVCLGAHQVMMPKLNMSAAREVRRWFTTCGASAEWRHQARGRRARSASCQEDEAASGAPLAPRKKACRRQSWTRAWRWRPAASRGQSPAVWCRRAARASGSGLVKGRHHGITRQRHAACAAHRQLDQHSAGRRIVHLEQDVGGREVCGRDKAHPSNMAVVRCGAKGLGRWVRTD